MQAQAALSHANNKLQATLGALPDLMFEVSLDGRIHQYQSHRSDLLAAPPELFLGKCFADILPPQASAVCQQAMDEAGRKGFSAGLRYALDLPQGECWFDLSVAPLASSVGGAPHFIFIARDITERKRAEKQLELAGLVFQHAREGIMVSDPDGVLVDVNEAFCRITGYSRSEVLGKNARLLSSGRQGKEFYRLMWTSLLQAGYWSGEVWNRRKDGEEYAELLTISTVRNDQGQVVQHVALFSDITPLKRYQLELESIAHFDALTGLPNRLLLSDRLQQAMAQAARRGQKVMVAYLDLDGFKSVNDQYGHAVGDRLLVALGHRLQDHLRDGDTLARLGGDEFVAILVDLEESETVLPLIAGLIAATAEPFHIDGLTLRISASVGVTSYPQSAELDADQLLRQADQAMYQAKLAGKNRYHVFDTQRDSDMRGHFESLERMRQALCRKEFVLHYQPKVNMRSGQLIGVEALIRWQHPERGLMPPLSFLPAIEEHQLSIDVGEWVMDAALAQQGRWRSVGLHIPVSVNVGALQLQQPDFVQRLQALLQRYPDLRPGDLQFEILETSALQEMQQVTAVIGACKALGVDFALDDFGTGYSSLTYLRQLPVHILKIDQSFVRDMLQNTEDQAILRGVLGLARSFGREVIAEGVETQAHGALLLQMGCEAAQGYGIARPMIGDAIPDWLQRWNSHPQWLESVPQTLQESLA
ncbi:diguanylate cyclase [Rhodoferax lacus]|uniref:Diguanylate cyclase n=2 Tax=Rhodoferax lacus TaxID=2184758 RepID=A0A3E1RBR2_9BURK|nr:diguanylate cyclase [Rhodoferax lacus]